MSQVDNRTLMARALGLAGCDYREALFNKYRKVCWPNLRELQAELPNHMLGIKLDKRNRDSYPPGKSGKKFLVDWLSKHPIQGQEEIRKLQDLVARLKLNAAHRAPRQRKPRHKGGNVIADTDDKKVPLNLNAAVKKPSDHGTVEKEKVLTDFVLIGISHRPTDYSIFS